MNYELITYEQFGAVVRICHNRPEKSNAESSELLAELDQAFIQAGKDDSVRVVILGGKGKHFSAGHDLGAAKGNMKIEGGRLAYPTESLWDMESEIYFNYSMNILDFPKPTIAQVQGACMAGGFMVANMCDLMVASEDAYFADNVLFSLACAAAEVLIHPYVLGLRKAKEMLFTGERISASDALAAGMVNRVVPRDKLEEETMAMAQRVAMAPPFAIKMLKRSLNSALDAAGFRTVAKAHHITHLLTHTSNEAGSLYQKLSANPSDVIGRNKQISKLST